MQVKAGVFFKPLLDLGMLVGLVVVQDQMQIEFWRCLLVNLTQEGQPFLVTVTVPVHAGSNDSSVSHVQGGKRVVIPLRL